MPQVVIENPILNSPFAAPRRHFKFTEEGITNLGFNIPYSLDSEEHGYLPDFVVKIDDGRDPDDWLNLILEVIGEARKDKAAKTNTARTLWVPAINNHGGFGRWPFIAISDPWDAKNTIRALPGIAETLV